MKTSVASGARAERGFSIIEALIAGLVLSFGMLAVTGMQIALTRNADVAKQRTEATRLAQQKIEEYRSFQGRSAVAGTLTFDTLVSGNDTRGGASDATGYATNTIYARTWTVTADPAGPGRHRIVVTVGWLDRAGQQQAINLASVISDADHASMGKLMAHGGGTRSPQGNPSGRSRNVPYPAQDIGNGRSAYQWPVSGGGWVVFNNANADVIYVCATQPTSATDLAATCTATRGYIVAGYMSRGSSATTWPWTGVGTGCTLIDRSNILADDPLTTPDDGVSCFIEDVIIQVPNPSASGPSTVDAINPHCPYFAVTTSTPTGDVVDDLDDYKCYAALVILDPAATTGWSGRMEFTVAPTGTQSICSFDLNLPVPADNGRYVNVSQSLNNENYFVRGSGTCQTGTTQHQP